MTFNQNLQENIGQVFVRRIWENEASTKNQCTVQFAVAVNRTEIPQDFFKSDSRGATSSNPLVALAQVSNFSEGFIATAIMSVNKSVVEASGLPTNVDYSEAADGFVKAEDLFDTDQKVVIEAYRCTEANPFSTKQSPVTNPSTGEVVVHEGKNVYQHTQATLGNKNTFTFGVGLPNWIASTMPKQATKATAEVDAVLDAMSA